MSVNISLVVENVTQIKSGITINVGVIVIIQKNIICDACKKYYTWNPTTFSCENGKYLGSVIGDSEIRCDETINAADSVSTNLMSTASTNVTITASINFHNKKVRYKMDCYILHAVLLLFMIALVCYHYTKRRSKQKRIGELTI